MSAQGSCTYSFIQNYTISPTHWRWTSGDVLKGKQFSWFATRVDLRAKIIAPKSHNDGRIRLKCIACNFITSFVIAASNVGGYRGSQHHTRILSDNCLHVTLVHKESARKGWKINKRGLNTLFPSIPKWKTLIPFFSINSWFASG